MILVPLIGFSPCAGTTSVIAALQFGRRGGEAVQTRQRMS